MRIDNDGRLLMGATEIRGGNFNNGSGVDSQFLRGAVLLKLLQTLFEIPMITLPGFL